MRFLIVTLGLHPDVIGGAWRVAAAQAAGLAARGHRVDVITARPRSLSDPQLNSSDDVFRDGYHIHRFIQPQGDFLSNWKQSNYGAGDLIQRQLASDNSPTLVVQHHAYLGPAVDGALPRNVPVLHVYHGPWAEEFRLAQSGQPQGLLRRCMTPLIARSLRGVERNALKQARRIFVLSRHFAQRLAQWHPRLTAPVTVVPGGVDLRRFTPNPDRNSIRDRYGLRPGDTLFVALRRLDPRMGLGLLLEAFARVRPHFPNAHLWLTGRGPAESSLRAYVDRLQLNPYAKLLGFIAEDDIPRLLNAADATLMPSLDLEGFGLATAESLACGTPVLGSGSGATPELLEPLDPNLIFAAGSIDGIADHLQRFLANPTAFPSREQCARYAHERFLWDRQIDACERAGAELTATS